MADVKWTPSQQAAIDADDRTLLVSAAAGSGKTAVLTERIIEKLSGGSADIGRMLIVTFTRAAAKELKTRITDKLSKALAKDPANRHLAKQLSRVAAARISTIDSFCIDIVKRNFDKLGLPCGIRIADTAEIELLKIRIMDAMFDDLYDEGSPFEGFERFTDCFIADKDDDLPSLFLQLYNDLCTMTEGIELINRFADMLAKEADIPFLKTTHGRYLRSYTEAFLDTYLGPAKRMRDILVGCAARNERCYNEYDRIVDQITQAKEALGRDDYTALCAVFASSEPISFQGASLSEYDEAVLIKGVRANYASDAEYFRTEFYSESEDNIRECYRETEEVYRGLYRLLSAFDGKLREEKLKRKIMDFNDAERYALSLLCKDGKPTEAAVSYGEQFDEIYIDEYQDINELQDTIFTMISGSAHRFMVGDIKQSIYGFRGSEPDIFADYRDRFPVYDKDKADETGTIFLSNNFRCSKPVIDFCNNIFSMVMANAYGGVAYLPEDDLVYSKREDDPVTAPVEFTLVHKESKKKKKKGEPEEKKTPEKTEEQVVTERIQALIEEGYSPNDIVILLRSPKNKAEKYEEALKALKIPCFNAANSDFFANPEILLVMCLLNVIDNPRRDIYLAGALQSPIFGFTLDDMVEIRLHDKDSYLYDSLIRWYNETSDPKGQYFFEMMEDMRAYAAGAPIDKLIRYIYTKTAMLSLSYGEERSRERRANLMMLYEYARTFESGSFKGLYNFILYVNNLIENSTRIKEAKTGSDATPTVKIMSIHNSKGLEFPVCFLCECDSQYTNYNSAFHKDSLIRDPQLGIAVYTPEQSGMCKINGILRRVIKLKKQNDEAAEEMRLLYVALTRAKDRLIVTSTCSNADTLYDRCSVLEECFSPYSVVSCKNYMTLMRLALLRAETDPCWAMKIVKEYQPEEAEELHTAETARERSDEYYEYKRLFTERVAFRYPHTAVAD
ncbi:MAG: UvrD-helicase domain-containing protein, partial [Clostridia bacterium]|nr:UvrD-helicase domain-containing protein [Clostridia bacterium]